MTDGVSAPSRLVLGSAQWGSQYGVANRQGPPDEGELSRILDTAAGAGIRTIDTARGYGRSEELIGRLTTGDPGWEVVTKLAHDLSASGDSAESGLEGALQSLAASRQALRRDRLDVVLVHRASHRLVHGGAIWRLLVEQRSRGQIGSIGVSTNSPEEALAALDEPEVDAVQVATSLLDQRLVRAGFFDRARERSMTVFVRSVFLQGVAHLDPEQLPAHLSGLAPVLAEIAAWSRAYGLPRATPYLSFVRSLPASVVVGVERCDQLAEILTMWSQPGPSSAELRALAAGVPELEPEVLSPSLWPA